MAAMRLLSSEFASVSRRCEPARCSHTQLGRAVTNKARQLVARIFAVQAKPRPISSAIAAATACACLLPEGPYHLRRGLDSGPTSRILEDDGDNIIYDILGIAQSMVDVTTETAVADNILDLLRVEKGGRRVLASVEERSSVLSSLEDSSTKITPGGSLSNTLVAISRLSKASGRTQLSVALNASCSSDAIGQFFAASLSNAGVAVLPKPMDQVEAGHTGTVFVLPSEDGQRSFLSYFQAEKLQVTAQLKQAISRSRLVVIEGYLWEMPNAAAAITEVIAAARASGAQVALTAGDAGVVARNRDQILKVLDQGGKDIIFFANKEEACELQGKGRTCSAETAAMELGGLCSVAIVTDGGAGSYISCMGEVHTIPRVDAPQGVVDTCGAGDAYAAGFFYALMMGHGCATAGGFASCTAAKVISRHGAQLEEGEARELAELLPLHSEVPQLLRASAQAQA